MYDFLRSVFDTQLLCVRSSFDSCRLQLSMFNIYFLIKNTRSINFFLWTPCIQTHYTFLLVYIAPHDTLGSILYLLITSLPLHFSMTEYTINRFQQIVCLFTVCFVHLIEFLLCIQNCFFFSQKKKHSITNNKQSNAVRSLLNYHLGIARFTQPLTSTRLITIKSNKKGSDSQKTYDS